MNTQATTTNKNAKQQNTKGRHKLIKQKHNQKQMLFAAGTKKPWETKLFSQTQMLLGDTTKGQKSLVAEVGKWKFGRESGCRNRVRVCAAGFFQFLKNLAKTMVFWPKDAKTWEKGVFRRWAQKA